MDAQVLQLGLPQYPSAALDAHAQWPLLVHSPWPLQFDVVDVGHRRAIVVSTKLRRADGNSWKELVAVDRNMVRAGGRVEAFPAA